MDQILGREVNHYPRHIGDVVSATVGLSLMERGAYTALLDMYYLHERPLPTDRKEIYRLAVCANAAERKAVDYVLGRYFTESADGWRQKRCDEELDKYREKSAKASQSASSRWSDSNANAMRTDSERNANASKTHGKRNTSHKPVTSNQEPGVKRVARTRATRPQKTPAPDGFKVSDRVRQWAAQHGYDRLDQRLEHFVGKATANGYRYVDWDEAFMAAIRDDWAKLGRVASTLSATGQRTAASLTEWMGRDRDGTDGP